nr:lipoate--protein ligase [Anaerotruncus rubiinfantis]
MPAIRACGTGLEKTMAERLCYLIGAGYDPYENLALEELLVRRIPRDTVILYLWQNQKTVVIGRNQNAWKECRIAALEADGGKLARRLSGGGAVFHDLGNLNFTFLANRPDYDVDRQLAVILRAVESFGLRAEKSGRNDVTAAGRKFSGNAFYRTAHGCYHHGTLLIDVDLAHLSDYLSVSVEKLAAKGVDSVRSRVVNLHSLERRITVDTMRDALLRAFGEVYGGIPQKIRPAQFDPDEWAGLKEKYASWQWRLGQPLPFTCSFGKRFGWGNIELRLAVQNGQVAGCEVFSDAMDADLIDSIPWMLEGAACSTDALCAALTGDAPELCDIRSLIRAQQL